jgi:hypothetical protein
MGWASVGQSWASGKERMGQKEPRRENKTVSSLYFLVLNICIFGCLPTL